MSLGHLIGGGDFDRLTFGSQNLWEKVPEDQARHAMYAMLELPMA